MKVISLPTKEYKKVWERFYNCRRLESDAWRAAKELDRIEGGDKHTKHYLSPKFEDRHKYGFLSLQEMQEDGNVIVYKEIKE